jgi:threonine synthase
VEYVTGLRCIHCGAVRRPEPTVTLCTCGGLHDVEFDYERIAARVPRPAGPVDHWSWLPFLPLDPKLPRPALRVGGTPLYRAERLGRDLGLGALWIKEEGLNPTGSSKDRASAVGVVKALEAGAATISCASTGNAASSVAGCAASAGLKSVIFVPERAPQAKVTQLLIYGATVVRVRGTYHDAYRLSRAAIERWGWYSRNAAVNPYLVEGKKTVGLELPAQLDWQVPDWAVMAVGDGCSLAGMWKGFRSLFRVGWTGALPRLLGVQAEGAAPLWQAWRAGARDEPAAAGGHYRWRVKATGEETLADSIAVGVPRNPDKALNAITESAGSMVTVSDEQILQAMRRLGAATGIWTEPAGAAAFAGLLKAIAEGIIGPGESVALVVTGSGLKDLASGLKAVGEPLTVVPDLAALEQALAL